MSMVTDKHIYSSNGCPFFSSEEEDKRFVGKVRLGVNVAKLFSSSSLVKKVNSTCKLEALPYCLCLGPGEKHCNMLHSVASTINVLRL
jgi:hypothetical protein